MGILKCYCDAKKKNDQEFTKNTLISGYRMADENTKVDKAICY